MHLITFLQLRQPGPAFRAMVILAQVGICVDVDWGHGGGDAVLGGERLGWWAWVCYGVGVISLLPISRPGPPATPLLCLSTPPPRTYHHTRDMHIPALILDMRTHHTFLFSLTTQAPTPSPSTGGVLQRLLHRLPAVAAHLPRRESTLTSLSLATLCCTCPARLLPEACQSPDWHSRPLPHPAPLLLSDMPCLLPPLCVPHLSQFVGFLEEEAVKTYTHALVEIDAGRLWKDTPAPPVAVQYWGLKPGANMRGGCCGAGGGGAGGGVGNGLWEWMLGKMRGACVRVLGKHKGKCHVRVCRRGRGAYGRLSALPSRRLRGMLLALPDLHMAPNWHPSLLPAALSLYPVHTSRRPDSGGACRRGVPCAREPHPVAAQPQH